MHSFKPILLELGHPNAHKHALFTQVKKIHFLFAYFEKQMSPRANHCTLKVYLLDMIL